MMSDVEDEGWLCRLADTAFYFLTGWAGEGEGDYDLV